MVTGSSSGIGEAIAWRFAKLGYRTLLHGGANAEKLQQLSDRFAEDGLVHQALLFDLGNSGDVDRFVDDAWSRFGRVDVLVNNAGVDLVTQDTQLSLDEKLGKLIDVDVQSTMLLSLKVGERMREVSRESNASNGHFSICNIGWDQAYQGMAGESGVLFSTSKGAIMSMTKSLAQSLAPEVRVNCVAPGWIQTKWGVGASDYWQSRAKAESLMDRWGTPEDVANMVGFLSGAEASFVSGQVINVNGGFRYNRDSSNLDA